MNCKHDTINSINQTNKDLSLENAKLSDLVDKLTKVLFMVQNSRGFEDLNYKTCDMVDAVLKENIERFEK